MSRHDDPVEDLLGEYMARRIDRRQFFKRAAVFGVSLSSASALLAACGGGDEEAAPPPPAETGAAPQPAPAPEPAEPPPAAGPVSGGTLIEGYDRDFTKMDTVSSGWADPGYVAIYEFTVSRDPDGNYVPAFADSWEISDDLLTWTLTFRPDLKFHSGAPVTAQVIADNFNEFRGANGQNAIFWPTVKDVQAPDATTVVVTMNAPFTAFPETLATEYSMIENLARRAELADNYGATEADGTGPFTLTSFKPGTEVVVTRWEEYPGTNIPFFQNKGAAYLDSVKWVPLLELGNRANEIETGNVHVVKNPAGQDVERLKSNSDLVTIIFPALANFFIAPNYQLSELGFDDINVRQAISHAIDRESLVENLYFGQAVATYGPFAPNFKWYDPGVEQFNQFDQAKANELLDGAGWTMGSDGIREKDGKKFSFTMLVNGGQPTTQPIIEAVVGMLKDVGIEMKLDTPDPANWFGVLTDPKKPPDAWSLEWLWSAPVDLLIFFQATPTKEYNGDLPEIAAAVTKWQTAPEVTTLESASRDFQLAWAEKLPEIPILTTFNVWVHQKNVMGYTPLQTMLYPYYNDVWLAA